MDLDLGPIKDYKPVGSQGTKGGDQPAGEKLPLPPARPAPANQSQTSASTQPPVAPQPPPQPVSISPLPQAPPSGPLPSSPGEGEEQLVVNGKRGVWKIFLLGFLLVVLGGVVYAFLTLDYLRALIGLPPRSGSFGVAIPTTPRSTPSAATSLLTPVADRSTPQGRDQIRYQDLQTIQSVIEDYYTDSQAYPVSLKFSRINDPSSIIYQALVPNYISADRLPSPPQALQTSEWYGWWSDGTSYQLTAKPENATDVKAELLGENYLYVLRNEPSTSGLLPTSSAVEE